MSERYKVALTMPHYNGVASLGAARGMYYYPSAGGVEIVSVVETFSSILPHVFNHLLAHALEMRDLGHVTHFAMLHADIAPEAEWLDKLAAIMARENADLVSAVVPIKEQVDDPPTSTAVGSIADPWMLKRYIRKSDRGKTPATFSAADVCQDGEVLLVNTGCFLADVRRPWWDDFSFQFHCRIGRDANGKRQPQTRPEDWEMSRHLQAHGAKVCATWDVAVTHEGNAKWPNY